MKTLQLFSAGLESVPAAAAWYLADLAEARGRQELYVRQSPQRLNILRRHAVVESAVSSNRIEGIEIDQARLRPVLFGKVLLRDRDEEEVRGYQDALNLLHEGGADLPVTEASIRKLHKTARGDVWDAGRYKERDGDIIERYPDGRQRVRFETVRVADTAACMKALVDLWRRAINERWIHPLLSLAAFNLDFLCIHPFRDGNGRVSRLLLLLQCYHLGFDVGRYISLERLIEQRKDRYYETLETSSLGWHEGGHNPWPYIQFLLSILKEAYKEFESRLALTKTPRGAKREQVEAAASGFPRPFALVDMERACPGVSRDMIRKVLRDLRKRGVLDCLGRGPGARWKKRYHP